MINERYLDGTAFNRSKSMQKKTKLIAIALAIIFLVLPIPVFNLIHAQTAKTAPDASIAPIRVACVGDSITALYPYYLYMMLGSSNYTVGNFGVGGSTVSLDFDKPYMNQTAATNALNFAPNIVVIMLGTNDGYLSTQQRINFTSDYATLIAKFQALPSKPRIYIATPPPAFNNTTGLDGAIVANDVMPLVKQTASQLGLPLIDMYTPLVNHPEDFLDGIHPNSQGAQVIAQVIFNAIT